MYIDFNLKVDRGSYCEYVNRNFQIQTSVFQKKKKSKTSHPTNQPLTTTYSRSPNHAPLFSISCHRSPLLLHYLRTAANSRTHNRSQSLSLPIYIYIYIDPIYRDSYPRLCVALRNKHRQKLIMRPWSIIIRPLSSAAFLPAYYCSRFRTIRSRSCLYHPRVNRYRPTVKVSTLILSLRQTEPVALFQKWNDNSSSLFLYFFLFSLFFFFFWNTHTSREKRDRRRRKED